MESKNNEGPAPVGEPASGPGNNSNNEHSVPDDAKQELLDFKHDRDLLVEVLEQAGAKVDGDAVTCPFHDDRNPSGSIHKGNGDGAWLHTCHAECEWSSGDIIAVVRHAEGVGFEEACERLRAMTGTTPNRADLIDLEGLKRLLEKIRARERLGVTGIHKYSSAAGCHSFLIVRLSSQDKKTFRPVHKSDNGWVEGDPPGPRPLFRLPDLDGAGRVYVVEGEKCADALREFGFTATTSAYGAESAKKTDWSPLAGRELIILPDNDEAGRRYAADVVEIAMGLDPPATVKVALLPDLPPGGDVADFLAAKKALPDKTLRRLIEYYAEDAKVVGSEACVPENTVPESHSPIEGEQGMETQKPTRLGLRPVPIGEFLEQPDEDIPWIVEDLLPAGGLSLLVARPKVGKSTLARSLILDVARGEPFLGRKTIQGPVFYLCLEDIKRQVRKSFKVLGASPADPLFIQVEGIDRSTIIKELGDFVRDEKPVLIVVDTLLRFVSLKDANDYAQVIQALDPVLQLARRSTSCHIMFLYHAGKTKRQGGDDVLGSTAFYGTVDTVVNLEKNNKNGARTISAEEQRYGAHLPETTVRMDDVTGRISGRRWIREAATTHDEILKESIRAALADGPLTQKQLTGNVKGRTVDVLKLTEDMIQGGEVTKTGPGNKRGPYRYALAAPSGADGDSIPPSHPIGEPNRERNNEQHQDRETDPRDPDPPDDQPAKDVRSKKGGTDDSNPN